MSSVFDAMTKVKAKTGDNCFMVEYTFPSFISLKFNQNKEWKAKNTEAGKVLNAAKSAKVTRSETRWQGKTMNNTTVPTVVLEQMKNWKN